MHEPLECAKIAFSERTNLGVHRVLDRGPVRAEQVTAGGGVRYLVKEIRILARKQVFVRVEPIEDAYAHLWLEDNIFDVECGAELVEKFIILC